MASRAFRMGFTPSGAQELFVEVPFEGGACRNLALKLDCPDAASYEASFGRHNLTTGWFCDKPGDPSKGYRCQEHAISPFVCYAANGEAVAIAHTQRQLASLLGASRGLRVLDDNGCPVEEIWESAVPLPFKPASADGPASGAKGDDGAAGVTDHAVDQAAAALVETKLDDGHGVKRARHYSREELIDINKSDALKAKPVNSDLPPVIDAAYKEEPLDRRYSRDELRRPSLDQQPSSNLGSWRSDEMGAALGTSPPAPISAAFAQYGAQASAPGRNEPAHGAGLPGGMARRASDGAAPGLEVSKEGDQQAPKEGPEEAASAASDGNVAVTIGRVIPTVPEERLSIEEALEARANRFGLQVSSDEAAASEPVRKEGAAAAASDGNVAVTIGHVIPTVPEERLSMEEALEARARRFGLQVSSDGAASSEPVRKEGAVAAAAGASDGNVAVTIGRIIPTVPHRLSVENTSKARVKKFGMQGSNDNNTAPPVAFAPAPPAQAAAAPPLTRAAAEWGSGIERGNSSSWDAPPPPAAPAASAVAATLPNDAWGAPSPPAPPAAPVPAVTLSAPPAPASAAAAARGFGAVTAVPQPAAPVHVQSSDGWGTAAPAAAPMAQQAVAPPTGPPSASPAGLGSLIAAPQLPAVPALPQAHTEPPMVLQLGRPKGNWQRNPCAAVFVLLGCPTRADYRPGEVYEILGCFRCGNEAGHAMTCSTHKTGPLYVASQDGNVVSQVQSLAQLATVLGRSQVEIVDEFGDLNAKLAAISPATDRRPSPIASPAQPFAAAQPFPAPELPPSLAPPAQTAPGAVMASPGAPGIAAGSAGFAAGAPGFAAGAPGFAAGAAAASVPGSPGPVVGSPGLVASAPGFAAGAPGFAAARPAPVPPLSSPVLSPASRAAIAGRGPATLRLRWSHTGRSEVGLGKPVGSWKQLPCFGVNLMVNAEDPAELGRPGHRLVVFGAQRCGNEAGARGRCRHHEALFLISGLDGRHMGCAGSLQELAQKLGVDQAEVVATATGEPLAVYTQAQTHVTVPGALSPILGPASPASPLAGTASGALMPATLLPDGGLQLRLTPPIGNWTSNACRALDVVVASPHGQVLGSRRCGNEAGKKSRCAPHNEAVFTLTTDEGTFLGAVSSSQQLAHALGVPEVVLLDEASGQYIQDAQVWSLSNLQGMAAKVA